MKWYYTIQGGHTHVRVFMNGGKCGNLCFRNEEFELVKQSCPWIQFLPDSTPEQRRESLGLPVQPSHWQEDLDE